MAVAVAVVVGVGGGGGGCEPPRSIAGVNVSRWRWPRSRWVLMQ